MDKIISNKKKQIDKILKFLNQSKISEEKYNSFSRGFFARCQTYDFKQGRKSIPEIPDKLNRDFKLLYELVSNPDVEIYVGKWIIISLKEALKIYDYYCKNDHKNTFDIAYKYLGEGIVQILSCDLQNNLLFIRIIRCMYDFNIYINKDINFDSKKHKYINFETWSSSIIPLATNAIAKRTA